MKSNPLYIKQLFKCQLKFILTAMVCFQLFACGEAFYGPALLNNDISYQPKPMISDSIKTNYYMNAVYGLASGQNLDDEQFFGEFTINRAHAFKNMNLSYGTMAYFGNYVNGTLSEGDPNYFTSKSYWAYGFRTSINYVMAMERTEFRFPALELSYTKEMGDYANFRNSLNGQPGYYVNPNTNLFSYGGSAEIIWHQKKYRYNRFSFRLFLGRTVGYHTYSNSAEKYTDNSLGYLSNFSFMFQHKHVSFLYQSGASTKIGFIYSLK